MKLDPLSLKLIKAIQYNNPKIIKKDSKTLSIDGIDIKSSNSITNKNLNKTTVRKR